jgi:hypothetical protein
LSLNSNILDQDLFNILFLVTHFIYFSKARLNTELFCALIEYRSAASHLKIEKLDESLPISPSPL